MAKVISSCRRVFGLSKLAWRLLIGHGFHRQRLLFFLQLSVVALGAGGATVVLVVSSSFREAITEQLHQYLGEWWVRYYGEEQESRPMPIDLAYVQQFRGQGYLVEPAIHLPVLIEGADNRYEGVLLLAVQGTWWQHTFWQRLISPVRSWGGDTVICLSRAVAHRLGVQVGDRVTMVWLADPPRVRRLRVVALYEARVDEIDRQVAFVPLELGQTLMGWDSAAVQVAHVFPSGSQPSDSVAEKLSWQIPISYEIVPIEAIFPDIFDWLGLIEQNVQVILGIVLVLSFFSVASAFLVLQFSQRLRYELCWALGTTPLQLWSLTLYQALFLVGMGVVIGELLSVVLLASQARWEWLKLDPENYLLSVVPVLWRVEPFLGVAGVALGLGIGLSFIAYPWRRAVRLLTQTE